MIFIKNTFISELRNRGINENQLNSKVFQAALEVLEDWENKDKQAQLWAEMMTDLIDRGLQIKNDVDFQCSSSISTLKNKTAELDKAINEVNRLESRISALEMAVAALDRIIEVSERRTDEAVRSNDEKLKKYEAFVNDHTNIDEQATESLNLFTLMLQRSKAVFGEDKMSDAVIASCLEAASYATWRNLDPKQIPARETRNNSRSNSWNTLR